MTEWIGDEKINRSYCAEHAPAELRDKLPFGPHRTPAEEVAYLRKKKATLAEHISDPQQLAEFTAGFDKLIADVEAGRRRIGDPE